MSTERQLLTELLYLDVIARVAEVKTREIIELVLALSPEDSAKPADYSETLLGIECLLRQVICPSYEATETLKKYNARFDVEKVKEVGLTIALQELYKAIDKSTLVLADILPDTFAYRTARELLK